MTKVIRRKDTKASRIKGGGNMFVSPRVLTQAVAYKHNRIGLARGRPESIEQTATQLTRYLIHPRPLCDAPFVIRRYRAGLTSL